MSITFIEAAADGDIVSYEAFLSGTRVGEIRIQKDYQATDGLTIVYDPERKFQIISITRTEAGTGLLEHRTLCEEFYQYMHGLGYGMAVQIFYNGEGKTTETNGLLLYDHFDVHWDRYEIYALKFDEKMLFPKTSMDGKCEI